MLSSSPNEAATVVQPGRGAAVGAVAQRGELLYGRHAVLDEVERAPLHGGLDQAAVHVGHGGGPAAASLTAPPDGA